LKYFVHRCTICKRKIHSWYSTDGTEPVPPIKTDFNCECYEKRVIVVEVDGIVRHSFEVPKRVVNNAL
jgi:hypothetical protein